MLRAQKMDEVRTQIREQIGEQFSQHIYPSSLQLQLKFAPETFHIRYTFDSALEEEARKLLHTYKPDYGSIVIMDADTGAILALQNYERASESPRNWAITATFPAASVFKIVTATAALDRHQLSPDTLVMFNGSNHSLHRRNVLSNNVNRWTREMTLREAFGLSVNTFFGRLAFEKLQPTDLEDYAIRFGFNKSITSDLPFDTGFTQIPQEKNFHLAEIASGLNLVTRMSPLQGAMIAASVAAQGTMRVPYIVQQLVRANLDDPIAFQSVPITAAVTMSAEGAERLKVLMHQTVTNGTSRAAFRPFLKDRRMREIEVGGKTGSLTGDEPRGKTDWFVGYAVSENRKLAIAAVTAHKEFWTVKSAYLAQVLFKKYFRDHLEDSPERLFSSR